MLRDSAIDKLLSLLNLRKFWAAVTGIHRMHDAPLDIL